MAARRKKLKPAVKAARTARRPSSDGFDAQLVGEIGERQLSFWATQVGLNASRPLKDADGWDLTADLPSVELGDWGIPAAPVICRLQVKSSRKALSSVRISARTAAMMAQQPIPWFIVAFQVDGANPTAVRVRHFDSALIDEALRAYAAGQKKFTVKLPDPLKPFDASTWYGGRFRVSGGPSTRMA